MVKQPSARLRVAADWRWDSGCASLEAALRAMRELPNNKSVQFLGDRFAMERSDSALRNQCNSDQTRLIAIPSIQVSMTLSLSSVSTRLAR